MTPLAPRGDSLVKRTWRPAEDIAAARANHAYPEAGCQGEALSEPCSGGLAGRHGSCEACLGTGRVLRSGWDTPFCG